MKTYDIQDVIDAECNLEPIKCRNCESLEVIFDQYTNDAICPICGEWQLEIKRKENLNDKRIS